MLQEITASLNLIIENTQQNVTTLLVILAVPFGVFVISELTGKRLLYLGIVPRRWYGLPGIVLAPFLHVNWNHLFFNSIPLLVLSDFLLINGLYYFLFVTLFITLCSGLLIWCFAKPGLHVGASALITGYWGLLVCNIYQQGTITAILLGIVSLYYFAGIFYGIFPAKKGVSWEGHLFGLLSGLGLGYWSL